jgi:hypothetical protein
VERRRMAARGTASEERAMCGRAGRRVLRIERGRVGGGRARERRKRWIERGGGRGGRAEGQADARRSGEKRSTKFLPRLHSF